MKRYGHGTVSMKAIPDEEGIETTWWILPPTVPRYEGTP